jgi:hypothetical protein
VALVLEAFAAVDRTITARLDRHLGGTATAIAHHIVHRTIAATGAAVGLTTIGSASGATARLVLEAFVSVELLLRSGENELRAALTASQGFVLEHERTLLNFALR